MADPAREHTTYTWDPVSAAWVHERGPQVAPPPLPPDVHALQSYFFDPESKEWIRTVLAPMGRELAARWQGAHKIPDDAAHRAQAAKGAKDKAAAKKGTSAVGIVVIVVVLIVLLGGAGVVASQSGMLPAGTTPKPSAATSVAPGVTDPGSTTAATSAAPTAAATDAPPVPTVAPTAAPTLPPVVGLPAGPRATLPDGTIVVYTGPLTATRGGYLPTSFTVVLANGRAANGELTIVLGDLAKDPRLVSGLLNANGKIALDMPATLAVGQYPLSVVFKGSRATLATISVK